MGFGLERDLPVLSLKKPEFAREREWTNAEGNKLLARLLAVKDGKCLFERDGKQFPYEISQLSAEDQKLIEEFQTKTRAIPLL
jgi:hypothetical protein